MTVGPRRTPSASVLTLNRAPLTYRQSLWSRYRRKAETQTQRLLMQVI